MLTPQVDSWHGHRRSDDPLWNESAWFGFAVPERNLSGWFYYWHRPNMNLTAGGVAVWDDSGAERMDCLHYHWFPFNPLPRDGDMFDFELGNSMAVELVEPLREYKLSYGDADCRLDLRWHGTVEAQTDALDRGTSKDIGSFHYDQLGHVEGLVTVGGERFEVDTQHVRDRSWGVRRPFARELRGGLDMGWSRDGTAFVATMLGQDTPQDDARTSEDLAYGHLYKDGRASVATSGTRTVERGSDGVARRIVVDVGDAEGRTVHAEGSPRNVLHYDDLWSVDWMLIAWDEIDGVPGWGETQDMPARQDARRWRRSVA